MRISISLVLSALIVGLVSAEEHHGAGYYKKLSKSLAEAGKTSAVQNTAVPTSTKSSSTKSSSTKTSSTKTSAPVSSPTSGSGSNGSASCKFPTAPKTSSLSAPITVKAGQHFDGGYVRYDRGSGACSGQSEGGSSDAVFVLEKGASISNVIIGANQAEGIHCLEGGCKLNSVWWEDVCEDAFTVKKQAAGDVTTITGGGAKNADDKIIQHNGGGKIVIDGFCAQDFGKLYRSCGNCSSMSKREVEIKNSIVSGGKSICGVNSNYGDVCTLNNIDISSVKETCVTYKGNDSGDEPSKISSGVENASCKISGI